ncbi:DUF1003 domain-containing protein [Sphingomonas pokkalii]|uniref:DUF1003 domain-containing protein n=1 Tax=Sphingomonas pokkalii TaxID=2175090 RepID=A0A2U0SJ90_9SPHN|nr:DUF1003 domain-containing protein [Sphingomonas pokkalii]PVX31421.1 hypothetical protein DD559_08315 [Sphingomonas pokkalii]
MIEPHQGMGATLRQNIDDLTSRQREDAERATFSDKLADRITRFTGSMMFVALHLVLFGVWISVNLGVLPVLPRFDPTFVALAMVASVEAIFLSTFVLISQNRMAAIADRRADLDVHISLLTEHELTKLAGLVERIAEKLEVRPDDPAFAEIHADVQPVQVLDALDESRKEKGIDR